MPRVKIYGLIACAVSIMLGIIFFYSVFFNSGISSNNSLSTLNSLTFFSLTIPISIVALLILGTGFWVGWTIITIKVVQPMPELIKKKDNSRIKAVFLCLITLFIAVLFLYGIYKRSYWALAIPAAAVTLVILGMIFWVGIAIITTRSTLPGKDE